MDDVESLITFLRVIIFSGAGARIVYCLMCASASGDEATGYLKRAKNALIFAVAAGVITGFIETVQSYYS